MQGNRLKRAFLSSVTSALYQIVVIICGFITSGIIIRNYGSSWNGILSSIAKFLSLFSIVELGVSGSTRVALYKALAVNDLRKVSAVINANDRYYRKVAVILVLYVAILAWAIPLISNSTNDTYQIALMVIVVGLGSFAEHCWGINSRILLMANQSRYIVNIAQTIATIVNATLLILIVRFGGSIFAAKAGSSIIYTIVPISLFWVTRRLIRIDKNERADMTALKGRWDVLANSLSNVVNENVDVFFITMICSSSELSVYSLYYVVAGGLTRIFQVLINGIEAGFGNMWASEEKELLKIRLKQFEYIVYSLAYLLFGCMIVLIVPFMGLYMNGVTDSNYIRYSLGITIGIAQVFASIRNPYVLLVQAAGHYKQVKLGAYIEAGINIVITWLLVYRFGIVGAVIGTIVANVFRTIQYGIYVSKHMINRKVTVFLKRMLFLMVILSAAIITSHYVINNIIIGNIGMWIVAAIITFSIHAIYLMAGSWFFYRADFIDFVRIIKRLMINR